MNGLDESGVKLIRNDQEIQAAWENQKLLASHNREDIEILCDEVYQVQNSQIEKR